MNSKQDQSMTRIINPTNTLKNPYYNKVVGPYTKGQESSMAGHRLKTINWKTTNLNIEDTLLMFMLIWYFLIHAIIKLFIYLIKEIKTIIFS